MKKPWSGRFTGKTAASAESFTESISYDKRLWKYDIQGSIAHARMLARQRVITAAEARTIVAGLKAIADDIDLGRFRFTAELEDIHMNIEAALVKRIGPAGKKLHTARSRNDQVALDLRLYLRDEICSILQLIRALQKRLLTTAELHVHTLMPGYTHLQQAQPIVLGHHLLAYAEMFQRDRERFIDCERRLNVSPLGACALAGTSINTDRRSVARELRMRAVSANSMDAVSDRDFAIEFLSASSITAMHLSRFSEELVLWSTSEFGFIDISDRFTTGSSIMPQKKNPDIAELVRGKTGRVYGNLVALLTLMKGLPLSYNRDMQEDKLPVFDTVDTIKACLGIMDEMLAETTFNTRKMASSAGAGYATATDLAEYLVRKGIPFRESHEITGRIVRHCISAKKDLLTLSLKDFRRYAPKIGPDIHKALNPVRSVNARTSAGGTAPSEVLKQIRRFRKLLA